MSTILLTGGTGFVGTHIRGRLTSHRVRLLVHRSGSDHRPNEELVHGDVTDITSLGDAAQGCDCVIHLVAIIDESDGRTFDSVIRAGTENMVAAAERASVPRFIHMSAMGAQANPAYPYLNAKKQAENAVTASNLDWTIFRPSVIFGPGDGFVNVLADLVRKAPILPVVGSGRSRFQPVAVDDIADAFARAVADPGTSGHIYELGGSGTYSYEEMLELLRDELGKKRRPKVHLPVSLMKAIVALSAPLPKALQPPVTTEQLRMLALDNCTDDSATEAMIGRRPVALAEGLGYIRH